MEVIPAIDLRAGQVVRLHQGDYSKETVYAQDPVAVAVSFERAGAPRLHIIDLDGAASGAPVHLDECQRIASAVNIPVQVGGGLRTTAAVERALASGKLKSLAAGKMGMSTSDVGDLIAGYAGE